MLKLEGKNSLSLFFSKVSYFDLLNTYIKTHFGPSPEKIG